MIIASLRISQITTNAIGPISPSTFERWLTDPSLATSSTAVPTLPFDRSLPVDTSFWKTIVDSDVLGPVSTTRLRQRGVPLRFAVPLSVPVASKAYLEIHLRPWSVSAIATVDVPCSWDTTIPGTAPSAGTMAPIGAATVGGHTLQNDLVALTNQTAGTAWAALAPGSANTRQARVVSVLERTGSSSPTLPVHGDPIHLMMHGLALGTPPPIPAPTGFVAIGSQNLLLWDPARLQYVLSDGQSLLVSDAATSVETRGDAHRRATLMLGHLDALNVLLGSPALRAQPVWNDWSTKSAQQLGRLYGPAESSQGVLTPTVRAYIERTGLGATITAITGNPLTEKLTVPPY